MRRLFNSCDSPGGNNCVKHEMLGGESGNPLKIVYEKNQECFEEVKRDLLALLKLALNGCGSDRDQFFATERPNILSLTGTCWWHFKVVLEVNLEKPKDSCPRIYDEKTIYMPLSEVLATKSVKKKMKINEHEVTIGESFKYRGKWLRQI